MADVRLKDPKSDFVAVVGSPIEAADLRARGYTDVVDEPPDDGPQESPGVSGGGEGSSGSESSEQTDTSSGPKPAAARGARTPKQ